jgi:hypothetical protein
VSKNKLQRYAKSLILTILDPNLPCWSGMQSSLRLLMCLPIKALAGLIRLENFVRSHCKATPYALPYIRQKMFRSAGNKNHGNNIKVSMKPGLIKNALKNKNLFLYGKYQ